MTVWVTSDGFERVGDLDATMTDVAFGGTAVAWDAPGWSTGEIPGYPGINGILEAVAPPGPALVDVGATDFVAVADRAHLDGGDLVTVLARWTDDDNYIWARYWSYPTVDQPSLVELGKVVAGVDTSPSFGPPTVTSTIGLLVLGDWAYLVADGDVITYTALDVSDVPATSTTGLMGGPSSFFQVVEPEPSDPQTIDAGSPSSDAEAFGPSMSAASDQSIDVGETVSIAEAFAPVVALGEPPAPPPIVLLGGAIYAGVRLPGGRLSLASDPTPPPFAAKVFRHPEYETPLLELTGLTNYEWQDRVGESGHGSITIPNLHSDATAVAVDDLVRFEVYGYAAFTAAIGARENAAHVRDDSEAPSTTFTGPGHVGLLSEMVVLPTRGPGVKPVEVDRLFSWPAPQFVDTDWPAAVQIQIQSEVSEDWGGIGDKPLLPDGWPDPYAYWIFDATGSPSWAPAGTRYARKTFTVDPGVTRVMVYFATDWRGELYFDGQLMLSQDVDAGAWVGTTLTQVVDVTPGEHTLAVWCENDADPEADETHNPGGILVSVFSMDPVGQILPGPLVHTDDTWKLIYPPSPPGMTVGEVILICLAEAQALGYLEGWEATFTRDVDSNGVPWSEVGDISTKVGTDYLTFVFDELAQTYCDVRAQPGGLVLDAYVKDTMGVSTTVDLHAATDVDDPSTGNLTELTFQEVPSTVTAFLTRWQGGWRLVDSEPSGRKKMALLGLGALPSEPEVDRVAGAELARKAHPRDAITAGFHPSTLDVTPYVAFRPGDIVTAPTETGGPSQERVMGITVRKQSDGDNPEYALEIVDVIRQQWERDSTALKKLSDGTLRGDARPAQPVNTISTPGPNCCPPQPPAGGG